MRDMKIKTYVINLKRSADRREYILKETARYACMDVELVEAVDGYRLYRKKRNGGSMSNDLLIVINVIRFRVRSGVR